MYIRSCADCLSFTMRRSQIIQQAVELCKKRNLKIMNSVFLINIKWTENTVSSELPFKEGNFWFKPLIDHQRQIFNATFIPRNLKYSYFKRSECLYSATLNGCICPLEITLKAISTVFTKGVCSRCILF